MFKPKIIPALVLGVSMTMLSSGLALAGTEEQPTILPVPPDQAFINQGGGVQGQAAVDDALLLKQREIDQYVFEQHRQEIEQKGFTVTHTGPMNDYVEVGITPYYEENAEYLYKIFGKSQVKVVEGHQAVLYQSGAATASDMPLSVNPDAAVDAKSAGSAEDVAADARIVSAQENDDTGGSSTLPYFYAAGGLVLFGGLAALIRKRNAQAK